MESFKKNETETSSSPSLKVNQKKKYSTCFSIGCSIPLILAIAFFVWVFASSDQTDSDKKDIAPASAPTSTQSTTTTKTKPPAQSLPKVTTPPRVTTNCDGNFIVPKSSALSINTNKPGLKKNINTHYYKIYGNTKSDILAGIGKCGPSDNGNNYAAFTRYKINWAYKTHPTSSGCRVENATVGVQIDVYYPKWKPTKDAEAGLADKWKVYYKRVEKHENVHIEDVLDTAKDILNYLNSLSNVPYNSIDRGVQPYLDLPERKGEKFDAKEYPTVGEWFK